jgi:AcrR family transcriptional regulator
LCGIIFIIVAQKSISRVYRSELRQQQAAQTRSKVVAAAAELFATLGYARTTFAKIAAAAGVSAQTVQAHGPKAALLKAAAEYVTLGESDKDDVFDLELGQRLVAAGDRDDAFRSMISVLSDMYGRGASLWLALAGAATMEAELRRYHAEWVADVTLQGRRLLEVCRDRGWLRDDIPFDDLVETTAVLTSPETYQRIVHHGGLSADASQKWLLRMLNETVSKR